MPRLHAPRGRPPGNHNRLRVKPLLFLFLSIRISEHFLELLALHHCIRSTIVHRLVSRLGEAYTRQTTTMGVQKKTRKFATVKRIIGQRDARLKKNQLAQDAANEGEKKKKDEVIREVYVYMC